MKDHLGEDGGDRETDDSAGDSTNPGREVACFRPGFWQQGQWTPSTPPRISAVQSWNVNEIEVPEGIRRAQALETVDGARAIVIRLAPGEELGEHQVRERAWLMVVDGSARIEAGGEVVEAGLGTLLTFEPDERHKVSSASGTRIVMILSSWPADGHYPSWPGDVLRSTSVPMNEPDQGDLDSKHDACPNCGSRVESAISAPGDTVREATERRCPSCGKVLQREVGGEWTMAGEIA